jgi:uncharacterized phage-associated protein
MIEFQVNKDKTLQSLLYLISEANARGRRPSQYDLVKATFLADRAHLNRYGRPITFDRYFAMEHGPVPSFAYDVLKPGFNWRTLNMGGAPWAAEALDKVHRFSIADVGPDMRKLSSSDQKCLADALTIVLSLTFKQIRKLTHEDRAYVDAWRDEEDSHAFPMNMELLLDEPDDASIDDLRHLAEATAA